MKPNRTYLAEYPTFRTLNDMLAQRLATTDIGMTHINALGVETACSWSHIVKTAQSRAQTLSQSRALKHGHVVGLALPNDARFLTCLFACWMTGAIPAPLTRPGVFGQLSLRHLKQIIKDAHLEVILCASEEYETFSVLADDVLIVPIDFGSEDTPYTEPWPDDPNLPALIQYTSGSSSKPRGVKLTHRNILASISNATDDYDFAGSASCTSWLPFHHDMGLVAACLQSCYRNIAFHVMEPSTFLQDPGLWLSTLSKHKTTITFANNMALSQCVKHVPAQTMSTLDLSNLRVLCLGGEPTDVQQMRAFIQHGQMANLNPNALMVGYGLAEAVVNITRTIALEGVPIDCIDRQNLANGIAKPVKHTQNCIDIASVGVPIKAHEIIIVADNDTLCKDREVGELWVNGPTVMSGYWMDQSSDAILVQKNGATWLKTGDLGYRVKDQLYICGRRKELIIIRGKNYYPDDIEYAAELVEGVRTGRSMAFSNDQVGAPEEVVLLCETKATDHNALITQIQRSIMQTMGLKITKITLCPPGTLPKTTSGKRQRLLARTLWNQHTGVQQ